MTDEDLKRLSLIVAIIVTAMFLAAVAIGYQVYYKVAEQITITRELNKNGD